MTSPVTAEKYLSSHHILSYLEDAICQLLEHKEDNSKVNPAKFFADYFSSINRGTHTLFREYRYVSATPYNRACFTHTFWKCFRYIGKKQDLLQVREFHALLSLLCFDFPYEVVQKTARIILMDDALDCLMSFPDFIYAFQVQFYFNEFLSKCAETFSKLLASPHSPRDTVVVPTETSTEEKNSPPHGGKGLPNGTEKVLGYNGSDTVDAQLFLKSLVAHNEKSDTHAPLPNVLREILLPLQKVSFYGFILALVKSESLNASIGKLPAKNKLLDYAESEKEAKHEHCAKEGGDRSHDSGIMTARLNGAKSGITPISRYAIHGSHYGAGANGSKFNGIPNGTNQNGTSGPHSPSLSSTQHHSRLHTPVSMSSTRPLVAKKGTAVGGSHEGLESGVGTASADGSAVDSTDSGADATTDDSDGDTSDDNET